VFRVVLKEKSWLCSDRVHIFVGIFLVLEFWVWGVEGEGGRCFFLVGGW